MTLSRQACCALLGALLLVCDSSAQSIGFWHLPSTQPQYCGFGFGPGHHVPMIRTHGCASFRVPRRLHTRECLAGGLAYGSTFPGECESPGCHLELDALVNPERNDVAPVPAERLVPSLAEGDQQVLPIPQFEPGNSPSF